MMFAISYTWSNVTITQLSSATSNNLITKIRVFKTGTNTAPFVDFYLYSTSGTYTIGWTTMGSATSYTTAEKVDDSPSGTIYEHNVVSNSFSTNNITATTINARTALQENGTALSSKYLQLSGGTMTGGLTVTANVTTQNIYAHSDSTYSIGTSSTKFKDAYFSGTVNATTFSGNASSATKLATARTIWGQSFDGSGNITGIISTYGIGSQFLNGTLKSSIQYGGFSAITSSYHSFLGIKTSSGNYVSYGGLSDNIGFYGFYASRVEANNGSDTDWRTYWNTSTGNLIHTGNVGIGTTSPAYKLDVSGTGRFTSKLNADSGITTTGISQFESNLAITNISSWFNNEHNSPLQVGRKDYAWKIAMAVSQPFDSTSKNSLGIIQVKAKSISSSGWLSINPVGDYTNKDANGISQTGSVIIGGNLDVPNYTLDVRGTGRFTGALYAQGTLTASGQAALNGGATIPADKTLKIGDCEITYDADNECLTFSKSIASTGEVTAYK
jgi:hypothetical protein